MSVLAGTDVLAEFGAKTVAECMVMIRCQQARELEEEAERMRRQAESGAVANPIQENIVDRDEWIGGLWMLTYSYCQERTEKREIRGGKKRSSGRMRKVSLRGETYP
uniref:Uncharacterized protein n=1 Tax=Amphimedon queenslandica TaxID=400682 RepID=A0A1X7TBB0_AMPQE